MTTWKDKVAMMELGKKLYSPPTKVEQYRSMEAVDSLINAFQDIFGKEWYPPAHIINPMVLSLDAMMNAPEMPALSYEYRHDDWSAACKPFVECVYMSIDIP